MQNGLSSDEIAGSILGRENIISSVVFFGTTFLEPGRVTITHKGGLLIIGESFAENGQRMEKIASILRQAVFVQISDNIHGVHSSKLLMNLMTNALPAMTGMTIGECGKHYGLIKIGLLITREAMYVMKKAGIRLEPFVGFQLRTIKVVLRLPLPIGSAVMKRGLFKKAGNIPGSTLQSLVRGKPTEIDYLNGEVVRLGEQAGINAVYNSRVVELVHEVERTGNFHSPDRLTQIFGEIRKG